MPECSRCRGSGEDVYDDEDGRWTDVCYHCAGSGQVEEELDFQDRLGCVATALAYRAESDYRKAVNSDPDGDGYDLGAYENMMMPDDYFRSRVWDREFDIMGQLCAMQAADQQFMVAWHEYPWEPMCLVRSESGVCEKGTRGCIRHQQRVLTDEQLEKFHNAKVIPIFRDEIVPDDEIPF